MTVTTKTGDIVFAHLITKEQNRVFYYSIMTYFGIQLTRSFASIPLASTRIYRDIKEQLIKDWCVQSWSKAVKFWIPSCSQDELDSV